MMFSRGEHMKMLNEIQGMTTRLEQQLLRCERLLNTVSELERRLDGARETLHLLFSDLQTALQAAGFLNIRLRELPHSIRSDEKKQPQAFDENHRQRDVTEEQEPTSWRG